MFWLFKLFLFISRWLFIGLQAGITRLARSPNTSHGTAKFATRKQLKPLFSKTGLIAGKIGKKFIRFNFEGYMLVIAKTRSGKGAGIVIPNLLTYRGSCIINDIKGENAAVTMRQRRKFGQVHHMNLEQPFISARLNPLNLVRFGTPHQVDDAHEIAKLLHTHDKNSDSHWNEQSTAGITALILHVMERHQNTPALQTLSQVRTLTAQTELDFLDLMQDLAERSKIGFVRETANEFISMDGSQEMKSIRSTMSKATRLWNADSPVSYITNTSDFDLMAFNHEVHSLYISIPEDKLAIYGRFLRLIQGCALTAITRAAKVSAPPAHPTLFMLDEAAAMGYLEPVERAAGYIAAYAKMILVFQDLDQLEKTYKKARSIIANAGCLVAFGVNDFDTASLLSKNLGHQTVTTNSIGKSQAWDELVATRHNQGEGATGRPLLDPSEILRLPQHQSLIFMRDIIPEPIRAEKVFYPEEKQFSGMFDVWREQGAHAHTVPTSALSPLGHSPAVALLPDLTPSLAPDSSEAGNVPSKDTVSVDCGAPAQQKFAA